MRRIVRPSILEILVFTFRQNRDLILFSCHRLNNCSVCRDLRDQQTVITSCKCLTFCKRNLFTSLERNNFCNCSCSSRRSMSAENGFGETGNAPVLRSPAAGQAAKAEEEAACKPTLSIFLRHFHLVVERCRSGPASLRAVTCDGVFCSSMELSSMFLPVASLASCRR